MAKIRMQWKAPKSTEGWTKEQKELIQYKGAIDVLRKVFKADGFRGLYKVTLLI